MRVHTLPQPKPVAQQPIGLVAGRSLPRLDQRKMRQLLQQAGLKISLARLKVLEMLCLASLEGCDILTRELHERLVEAGEPLSLVSVRQVVGRMVDNGLVIATGGSRFRLGPAWEASIFAQRPRNSSVA